MDMPARRPTGWRRAAAITVFLLLAAVLVETLVRIVANPLLALVGLALLVFALLVFWTALTRSGVWRWTALVALAAAIVAFFVTIYLREGIVSLSVIARLAGLAAAFGLARYALGRDVRTLRDQTTAGRPVRAAGAGVLIMNMKSGGGKAERFNLEDECRARGVEPIVLQRGDDLLQLAGDAIDRGADVVGMAGGDGSQALVARVAAERGVPMVVVPAGTRNHFAMDLGLDRDDVVGALDAYEDAVERRIDLAEVNGRTFVNNVSLGLYATIVRSPEYRDAKIETALAALPEMLGPGTRPFDLRFTGPDGTPYDGAHVIQVSNDPYGQTVTSIASRPRLDTGTLGVFALEIPDAPGATRFLADLAAGAPDRYPGYVSWETSSFELTSDAPVPVGLDGESLELDPPLVFSSRPGALRVRLPGHAIGYSPAARRVRLGSLPGDLWRICLGRPVDLGASR